MQGNLGSLSLAFTDVVRAFAKKPSLGLRILSMTAAQDGPEPKAILLWHLKHRDYRSSPLRLGRWQISQKPMNLEPAPPPETVRCPRS